MSLEKLERILSKPQHQLDRKQRKIALQLLREDERRIQNLLDADQLNGAGLPMDRQLRRLLKSANDDVIGGERTPLKHLWDVFGGFVDKEPCAAGFVYKMKPERDHGFDANDFFAFAGDPVIKESTIGKLKSLVEGTIYSYSVINDPMDVVFEQEVGDPVVTLGISMIRDGQNLFWQIAAGYVTSLSDVTSARREEMLRDEAKIRAANPMSSPEQISSLLNPTAKALEGLDDVWDCATFGMFDLSSCTHTIRASTRDWTVSQAVFTDRFESQLADVYETNEAARRLVDKALAHIERDRLLFELAETMFSLPAYFATKVQFVRKVENKTELGFARDSRVKYAMKAPLPLRIQTRTVSTLDFGSAAREMPKSFSPPRFRVEVEGYYRRLPPGQRGADRNGAPLEGMTWVKQHMRWKDKPVKLGVIRVKSAISDALERVKTIGVDGSQTLTVS